LEAVLAEVCAQVLGTADVGVNDDFLALSGDALLAPVVVSRVQKMFRIELPLHLFVEAPTLVALASALRAQGRRDGVDVDRAAELILQAREVSPTDSAELTGD
jgi:hypothetical protein